MPTPPPGAPSSAASFEEAVALSLPAPSPAPARGITRLHDGVLSEVYGFEHAGEELVLKLYRFDLERAVHGDPDPRFRAASRFMAIPPFFASSAERIARLGPGVETGTAFPEVLGEGRLADGTPFTLMRRLAGEPWTPARTADPSARRAVSEQLGALLAGMHARAGEPGGVARTGAEWVEDYESLLHLAADHLPAPAVPSEEGRWRLHGALQRIVQRLANLHLGPTVIAHGDCGPENLLFAADGRLCGLVDFQLSCPAPAAMDLRWTPELDGEAFLAAYGWPPARRAEVPWLARFFQMLWEGLILVVFHRYAGHSVPAAMWASAGRRYRELVRGLERE